MQNSDQTSTAAPIPLARTLPLSSEEVRTRIAAGERCVRFEYCISLLIATLRRQSPVYLTATWHERYLHGLGYSVVALLLGPWGIPWGLIWTPCAIWTNLTGGVDVTDEMLSFLGDEARKSEPIPTA